MESNVREILDQLNKGDIKYKDAIQLIKNINNNSSINIVKKKASKLKISVVDGEQSIKIPPIPFGLITFFIDIGFGISSMAMRFVDDFDEDVKMLLDSLDKNDIKLIFKELKEHGPFQLVNIQNGSNTEVKINVV